MKKLRLPRKIKTEKDVRDFFKYLLLIDKSSFHPDDNFSDYVTRDHSAAFTEKEAAVRNNLMQQSWRVVGDRIYDIGVQSMQDYSGYSPKDWSPYNS